MAAGKSLVQNESRERGAVTRRTYLSFMRAGECNAIHISDLIQTSLCSFLPVFSPFLSSGPFSCSTIINFFRRHDLGNHCYCLVRCKHGWARIFGLVAELLGWPGLTPFFLTVQYISLSVVNR